MSAPAPAQEVGRVAAVSLIAGREVRTRVRSKSFRWLTAAFVVAIILGGVAFKAFGGTDDVKQIAVMDSASVAVPQIEAAAAATGIDVEVSTTSDRGAAEDQLRSGDLDVLVTSASPQLSLVVEESLDLTLQPLFGALAGQLALVDAITELGGDPVAVTAQVGSAEPQIESLEPTPEVDGGQVAAGYITGILLFISLMTAGQYVAQGVVEEKSSRVVELLLSTVSPYQLMAGKVIGIGLIGLGQLVLVVGAGVGTVFALDLVDTSSVDLGSAAVWALVWFVIGFATYALVLAALASLVSRQEDVGAVIGPVTALLVIPYIVGISIAPWDPYNPLVVWMSYIPFCSPLIMPIRIAIGAVEPWEVGLSLILSVAVIPVLVWLSGRIYSNAVLRTGSRIKLKDALRGA